MAVPARSVALPLPAAWRRAVPGAGVAVPAWLPGLLLAVLLTLPAWAPFLRPDLNLWQLFDGSSHLRKAWLLAQQIKDGNWYPRWIPDLYGGYGYPTLHLLRPGHLLPHPGPRPPAPRSGSTRPSSSSAPAGRPRSWAGVYALAWRLWRHAPAAVLERRRGGLRPLPLPQQPVHERVGAPDPGQRPDRVAAGGRAGAVAGGHRRAGPPGAGRRRSTGHPLVVGGGPAHGRPAPDPQPLGGDRRRPLPPCGWCCLSLWRPSRRAPRPGRDGGPLRGPPGGLLCGCRPSWRCRSSRWSG